MSKCARCDGDGKEWVRIGNIEILLPCIVCHGFGREPLLIEWMRERRGD